MSDNQVPIQTDIPTHSRYRNVPVNGSVKLFKGSIKIKIGTNEVTGKGSITLGLSGSSSVGFNVIFSSDAVLNENEGELSIPSLTECAPAPFQVSKRNLTLPSGKMSISGNLVREGYIFQKLKADGKQEPAGRIEFHLINFPEYNGTSLSEFDEGQLHSWAGRVTFTFGKWTITLDQFPDAKQRLDEAKAIHGYVFTHIGVLRRSDNKLFLPDDARSVLEALYWFLSFVAGRRIAYTLPTGLRHLGYPLWQQWNHYIASPVRVPHNWFSELATQRCFDAAEPFYSCWSDENRRNWLTSALGLYFACNYNRDGIELVLAESQIGLEMLSWVALLEENSLMSEKGFNKLEAVDRIRALLFWLGINSAIPASLQQLAMAYPSSDAPDAVVDIRNAVIHPTKSNRARRAQLSNQAIYEAWQLNLWYIELTLLKLIGYSGPYDNRIGNPSGRTFDLVPWTQLVS